MTMVITYESAPGKYATVTTSGVETSQEGVALTLLLCVSWQHNRAPIEWYPTQSQQWVPSALTRKEGSVETGYTTYTRAPWGRSACPRGLQST